MIDIKKITENKINDKYGACNAQAITDGLANITDKACPGRTTSTLPCRDCPFYVSQNKTKNKESEKSELYSSEVLQNMGRLDIIGTAMEGLIKEVDYCKIATITKPSDEYDRRATNVKTGLKDLLTLAESL